MKGTTIRVIHQSKLICIILHIFATTLMSLFRSMLCTLYMTLYSWSQYTCNVYLHVVWCSNWTFFCRIVYGRTNTSVHFSCACSVHQKSRPIHQRAHVFAMLIWMAFIFRSFFLLLSWTWHLVNEWSTNYCEKRHWIRYSAIQSMQRQLLSSAQSENVN